MCLLALAASAEPIVLKTVKHTADLSSFRKRDAAPSSYPETLVNDLETYAVEIGLGEPAKNYRVVVDSGTCSIGQWLACTHKK